MARHERPSACKIRPEFRLSSLTWDGALRASAGIGSCRVPLWSALVVSTDLVDRPHPYQFTLGTGMPTQTQAVAAVHGWRDEAVYGSFVVSWRCQPRRRLTHGGHLIRRELQVRGGSSSCRRGCRAERIDPAYGSGVSASVSAFRERSGRPFTHVEGRRPKAQRPDKDRDEVLYPAVEIARRRRQMWRCRVKENPDQNVDNDEQTSCAEKGLEKFHSS